MPVRTSEFQEKRDPALIGSIPGAAALPPLATWMVLAFVILKLGAHFLVAVATPYEVHRDEFLYLAMGEHLRFWSMDFPPAIAVLANVARGLFGDGLFAVRFFPAVAGAAVMWLSALAVREFGGGCAAQGLAMLSVFLGPLFLRSSSLFQPVVFDQLWWTLGFFCLIRWIRTGRGAWWLLLGVVGGLGILTKFSVGFFALGLGVGLMACSHRQVLATRWPWVAVGLALIVGSASLVGQIALGFPVIRHMGDLQRDQLIHVSYLDFLGGQLLMLGPAMVLAIGGFLRLAFVACLRPQRAIAWTCLACFLLLLLLHGKAYYAGPIYPTLIAAGAAAWDSLSVRLRKVAGTSLTVLITAFGLVTLPFGLPILPPEVMARYAAGIGVKAAVATNSGGRLPLPQDYADMLGWREQVAAVAEAWNSLPEEKQEKAMIVARNYGEAGALEFYAARFGLPRRIMLPGNELLWPPRLHPPCEIVLSVGIPERDLQGYFHSVTLIRQFDHQWMVAEERHLSIFLAEGPRRPILDAWPNYQRRR